MSRSSIFEGSDGDRPGTAAGLMLVALYARNGFLGLAEE